MNDEKFYLGFNIGRDSSACVFSNVRGMLSYCPQFIFSGGDEFPFEAISVAVKESDASRIDFAAFSANGELDWDSMIADCTDESVQFLDSQKARPTTITNKILEAIYALLRAQEVPVKCKFLTRIEHHAAHEGCVFAYYGISGSRLLITCDSGGDGIGGRISYWNCGVRQIISEIKDYDSPEFFKECFLDYAGTGYDSDAVADVEYSNLVERTFFNESTYSSGVSTGFVYKWYEFDEMIAEEPMDVHQTRKSIVQTAIRVWRLTNTLADTKVWIKSIVHVALHMVSKWVGVVPERIRNDTNQRVYLIGSLFDSGSLEVAAASDALAAHDVIKVPVSHDYSLSIGAAWNMARIHSNSHGKEISIPLVNHELVSKHFVVPKFEGDEMFEPAPPIDDAPPPIWSLERDEEQRLAYEEEIKNRGM